MPEKINEFCLVYNRVIVRHDANIIGLVTNDRAAAEAIEINETYYDERCKNEKPDIH